MAYGDFKDLAKRTVSDKVLRDKAFNIAKNSTCDGYQRGLASMSLYIRSLKVVVLIMKLNKVSNWLKNYKNQILEKFKKEEFILHLKTIFGVLI